MIHHVTVGVSDLDRSQAFYRRALAPLGFDHTATDESLPGEIEFGTQSGHGFAISTAYLTGAPVHVAFRAASRKQPSTPLRSHAAGAITARLGYGRSTPRIITARLWSTPMGTTSRPSSGPATSRSYSARRRFLVAHRGTLAFDAGSHQAGSARDLAAPGPSPR
jgi:catechol 2,3-dioxygenase-like lactoylglutathione lyase family enzyme